MKFTPKTALAALTAVAVGALGTAQIESLDLDQMIAKTDNAVVGTILEREVIRIDHPVDGPELYYTTLIVQGRSLVDGTPTVVGVTFPGGFIDDEHGVWNSEAPSEDDQKVGNEVVVFYKWLDNMGGDLSGNALYASHGGIYRVVSGRGGDVVLGRGPGYSVPTNRTLSSLDGEITQISRAHKRGK
ncbi:MAG: hypothetical protein QF615_07315 [Planctomycetota bacterium]|jgi:hypothetical protein|nr:hypothetical protein [Planctomycetota bacterium]MDP6369399.1 hypothetical protein [Planctomycetota bacterium]MDP6518566.1 hypothetical protein [Planctomycetota bacterium]